MLFHGDHIAWQSPAGQRLDQFAQRLPRTPRLDITVFGSAPIQLLIDSGFASADIDLFGTEDSYDFLLQFVADQHWTQDKADFYIQVCDPYAFKSASDWPRRAIEVERHGHLSAMQEWPHLLSDFVRSLP